MSRFFRITTPDQDIPRVEDLLRCQGFVFSGLNFWHRARKLEYEPFPLGNSLAAFFGLVYIQDRSSMLPPFALNAEYGGTVLDMCASPGSKTGILARQAGFPGLVLANEPTPNRLRVLRQNMQHLGVTNVLTSGCRGENIPFPPGSFSHILLDVPCSGWGTGDKNPGIRNFWREDKLDPLLDLQEKLLDSAIHLLGPGGRLVYSTCTTNPEENEKQVQRAVEKWPVRMEYIPRPQQVQTLPGEGCCQAYKVVSEDGGGQGFFLALLGNDGGEHGSDTIRDEVEEPVWAPDAAGFFSLLQERGELVLAGDKVFRVPREARRFLADTPFQGAYLGKYKKKGFIPAPRMRVPLESTQPPPGAAVLEDVRDLEGLVHGRSLSAPRSMGACPLYWKDLALGWARVKGGRLLWTEK